MLTNDQELTNGFYQGLTGLVTQPHAGLQRSGSTGLLKGVGKGIGGVILKPAAGTSPFAPHSPSFISTVANEPDRHLGPSRLSP